MKKKILSLLALSTLLVASCDYNDKYFKELDDMSKPSDMKGVEYTLTDADYGIIAGLPANKELAKAMDMKGVVEDSVYVKALAELKNKKEFDDLIKAKEFIPAFTASKWGHKDVGTAVKVTYKNQIDRPEVLEKLNVAKKYVVSSNDYKTVWGDDVDAKFFTESKAPDKFIPNFLAEAATDAEDGDFFVVNYKYSINEPNTGGNSAPKVWFEERFEEGFNLNDSDWKIIQEKGDKKWETRTFNDNSYAQFSAYKTTGEQVSYLVTPTVKVEKNTIFTFDGAFGNYNGAGLTIHIAEAKEDGNYAWKDITSSFNITVPEKGYGVLANAGEYALKDFIGKSVVLGFKYTGAGDGITTTVQIDNVIIREASAATRVLVTRAPSSVTNMTDVYVYNGGTWKKVEAKENIYALQDSDYDTLGFKDFSSTRPFEEPLAKLLNRKFEFAKEDEVKTIVFAYYFGKENPNNLSYQSAQYKFDGSVWNFIPYYVEATSQFVRFIDNEWKFDPSIYQVLVKNDAASSAFCQSITDWVWENIDLKEGKTEADKKANKAYVTSYGNNDYYFGTSSYQNNVDLRLYKYRDQRPDVYGDMSDDEIKKLMMEERWPQAFKIGIEATYPEVDLDEDMDTFFTINFGVYTGSSDLIYEIKYKLVSKGTVEYIENSVVQIK